MLTFVNEEYTKEFLVAAKYVYRDALVKPYAHATPKDHLQPYSLLLFKNGSVTPVWDPVTTSTQNDQLQVVNQMPRPTHGIIAACVAAAMCQALAKMSKQFHSLKDHEIARAQQIVLFCEVRRASPGAMSADERKASAEEYKKYIEKSNLQLTEEQIKNDVAIIEELHHLSQHPSLMHKLCYLAHSWVDETLIKKHQPKDSVSMDPEKLAAIDYAQKLLSIFGLEHAASRKYNHKIFDYYHGDQATICNLDAIKVCKAIAEVDLPKIKPVPKYPVMDMKGSDSFDINPSGL